MAADIIQFLKDRMKAEIVSDKNSIRIIRKGRRHLRKNGLLNQDLSGISVRVQFLKGLVVVGSLIAYDDIIESLATKCLPHCFIAGVFFYVLLRYDMNEVIKICKNRRVSTANGSVSYHETIHTLGDGFPFRQYDSIPKMFVVFSIGSMKIFHFAYIHPIFPDRKGYDIMIAVNYSFEKRYHIARLIGRN